LAGTRHNLPQQLTSFIGREREIAEVKRLLLSARLLTLVGTGGCGKTRLSLQLATELLDEFPDGVYFVALAPITDPLLVATTIAQALGIKEEGEQPLAETLKVALRDKTTLLVLDNFEQVILAGPLVTDVLLACPGVKILITSRETLRLYGEHEFQVPPLALPNPKTRPALETLSQSEAVQLFVQRARSVKHDFALTEGNAPYVADICIRLDGLPLAIELASARVRVLPPQAMLARLGSALDLLTGGGQNLPPRQQTLRSAIAWSYDLLDEDERALFSRMAVFVGGASLDAAEWILDFAFWTSEPDEGDKGQGSRVKGQPDLELGTKSKIQNPLDGISSLVDKSLLRQVEGLDGEPRFLMLETIREYALERLAESGEEETLRRRHAQYFLQLAEAAEPELRGPQQVAWLERLEREHDNLRAALRWSIERHDAEMALMLSAALPRFWFVRGYLSEGRRWLNEALGTADFGVRNGVTPESNPKLASARARALNGAGLLAYPQGEYTVARSLLEQSLALLRELDDRQNIAFVLNGLGVVVQQQGDYAAARGYLEQSLAIRREMGDKQGIASTLNNLGEVARCLGDYDAARSIYEEGLAVLAEAGSKWDIASSLHNLAYVSHQQGDYGRAAALFTESLGWYRELGLKTGIAASLTGLAGVAGAVGQPDKAARLFGAAERVREEVGAIVDRADVGEYERNVAAVKAQLDEATFTMDWAEGRAMNIDEAIAYAQQEITDTAQPAAVPEAIKKRKAGATPAVQVSPNELTRREVEVLRLVAGGLTNPQVSAQLFLSHRTVEAHLHSIFGKLGVTTRGEAIRYAIEHDLV
jgi:non-specific serine/threonine protein kinase